MQETSKIWMNGELVDWADATVHVGAHGLHYGSGVFEGIRAYETPRGSAVFRLTEHIERLANSAQLLYMELPYSRDELKTATWDLLGANGLPECYLRPIAFFGAGQLGGGVPQPAQPQPLRQRAWLCDVVSAVHKVGRVDEVLDQLQLAGSRVGHS